MTNKIFNHSKIVFVFLKYYWLKLVSILHYTNTISRVREFHPKHEKQSIDITKNFTNVTKKAMYTKANLNLRENKTSSIELNL